MFGAYVVSRDKEVPAVALVGVPGLVSIAGEEALSFLTESVVAAPFLQMNLFVFDFLGDSFDILAGNYENMISAHFVR